MKIKRVSEPNELESTLKSESPQYSRIFVFFFGAEMEDTGESWCPDCVIADPKVRLWISKVDNCLLGMIECIKTLVEAPVRKSEYSRNPDYFYRTHPVFALKWIPTLMEMDKSGNAIKKIDEDMEDDDLAKFIS